MAKLRTPKPGAATKPPAPPAPPEVSATDAIAQRLAALEAHVAALGNPRIACGNRPQDGSFAANRTLSPERVAIVAYLRRIADAEMAKAIGYHSRSMPEEYSLAQAAASALVRAADRIASNYDLEV